MIHGLSGVAQIPDSSTFFCCYRNKFIRRLAWIETCTPLQITDPWHTFLIQPSVILIFNQLEVRCLDVKCASRRKFLSLFNSLSLERILNIIMQIEINYGMCKNRRWSENRFTDKASKLCEHLTCHLGFLHSPYCWIGWLIGEMP